ncbi:MULTISPECIES: YihY family inner membrane protein [unclassified Legionella]|uniref:YihY family inner membrane protein n=1 Tax=unclassified Legionella TaxID=2622702 RepID=UPI00105614B0|nr:MULTISPECIES: YihY family inner membrane protein [unclassified Legionella]MDI9818456.1 YihY family inner membrane protein [Legionella sp. PL877]
MDWKKLLITKFDEAKRFILFVAEHFIKDDCTYRASALAFTSLLAVVPLMTVGFAILSSFPVFQEFSGPVQDFIFENFVPATGRIVQDYLQEFTAQVSRLSIWGVAILFFTALLVMFTIEKAMNRIWRAESTRRGVYAFLLYWAILSLAPVLLGLSLAASSYVLSIPFIQEHHTPLFLLNSIPFFLSLFGFTFLYVVVPNCQVKLSHGLWGALVASLLFESAKHAFAYYLAQYNTYQLLYGAFATVPIFFVWVYWVWVITLLGAEISYALSVHHERRPGKPMDGFSHAVFWLHRLWLAQREGKGITREELVSACSKPFAVNVDDMINELVGLELIHHAENGELMLSRNLNQISLYWLTQHLPYRLPSSYELITEKMLHGKWQPVLSKIDTHLQEILDIDLNQLFSQNLVNEAWPKHPEKKE